ncbi:MAG: Calx-beta domain-containing protein [Planctomycetia bacterium]
MAWFPFRSSGTKQGRQRPRRRRMREVIVGAERLEERAVLAVMVPALSFPHPSGGTMTPLASASPSGLSAAAMRTAYGMDAIKFGSVTGDGTGQIIAIVDAYDEPTMASDLAAFNTAMSLPSCTLIKVNQTGSSTGLPAADTKQGWGLETAMDVEWAHAMAPKATILLVEANSASDADLYTAVDTARNWPGVTAVSMSWGGDETSSDSATDYHFTTPTGHTGVTFFASSGDNGKYASAGTTTVIAGYPAVSPNVVAVGGTKLTTGTGGTWVSEVGWGNGTTSYTNGGSGGGVSRYAAQPSYQKGVVPTSMSGSSTPKRTIPDIAADADPASGAPVYSAYDNGASTPWLTVGGTSLSSPMWAGMMAVFNQGRVANNLASMDGKTEFLPSLYTLSAADFHDVTTGNNGYAAAAGYDMVTGRGTPIGPKIAADLGGTAPTPTPSIGGFTVSPVSIVAGASFTLTATNVVETGGTISTVKFYRESNGSAGLQTSADVLVGTGVQSGTTWSLTVSSSGLAAGSSTFYAVATDSSNVSTAASTAVLTVTNPISTAPPTVTIASASVSEGNFGTKSLGFVVSLSAAAQATTTVAYATANGTATAGTDYLAASGSVTFRAGQRTATIVVTIKGDTTAEANETFTITLSSPVNCTLGTSITATGTILNDDGGALFTPKFSSNNTSIAAAIAKVPTSVGALTSVSIVDFGTTIYTGSLDVTNTLNRIRALGKSIDTNDGSVYSNGNGALSPRSGTWFEFVVDPRTGTNRSFSGVAFPGPMRVLLNTDGTTYFTGNHYSSFVSLWKPGSAPLPTIGTLTVSPGSVVTGGSFTLSANSVAEVGGSVTGVKFYRDTNGTTGLQVGSDTLVGTGTQSGSTWTLATTTGGLASGSYTFYAVASDAANASSAAVSAVLTVTNPLRPVIGSFTVSPASVTAGGSITLTASNVTETGGSVSGVTFYRETSGSAGLQVGSDAVVGSGTRSGTTWTLATTTAGLAPGSYTYYAVATDPANTSSLVASFVLAVTSPSTPTTPSVSISSASILEGNSGSRTLAFLVSLTAPAAVTTTVSFRTSDGSATAGSDYQGITNGTVTFRVGQRTATIVVQVYGDTSVESDETFQIELFNPVNATLGISTAVGTLLNDDVGSATPATRRQSPRASMVLAPARA